MRILLSAVFLLFFLPAHGAPGEKDVQALARQLKSGSEKTRDEAFRRLLEAGMEEPDRILPLLPEAGPWEPPGGRIPELRRRLGKDSAWRLAITWSGGDPDRRQAAEALFARPDLATLKAFAQLTPQDAQADAIRILASFLAHHDAFVRTQVAMLFGELGDAGAAKDLEKLLEDPQWSVRQAAARTLGMLKHGPSAPRLVPLLEDKHPGVLIAAATALADMGATTRASAILPLLEHPDSEVWLAAAEALGRLGERAASPVLSARLASPGLRRSDRARLGEAIGILGDQAQAPRMAALLSHADPDVRRAAANALGRMRARAYGGYLVKLLQDPLCAITALESLAALGQPSAIPPVAALLEAEQEELRTAAAEALGRLVGERWPPSPVPAARAWWAAHRDDEEFKPKR